MKPLRHAVLLVSAFAVAGFTYVGAASATQDVDCSAFEFQEEAQVVLDEDRSDPNGLDVDKDGIACESLPHRPVTQPTTPSPTPTPAPAPAPVDKDCVDFATHDEAQAVFDADPSDPNRLDADADGIACERLPGAVTDPAPSVVAAEPDGQVSTYPVGGVDTGGLGT